MVKITRVFIGTGMCLMLLILSGCFSFLQDGLVMHPRQMQPVDAKISPRFAEYRVKNIAVMPLTPSSKTEKGEYTPQFATRPHDPIPMYLHMENDGETAANLIEKELLGTFTYKPVDRRKLDKVLKELEFQLSDLVDADTVQRVGKLTGADAVLTGNVKQAFKALQYQSYGDIVYAAYIGYVSLELRLTDVETGDIIWICNIQRNSLNYTKHDIVIAGPGDERNMDHIGGGEVMFVMRNAVSEALATLK